MILFRAVGYPTVKRNVIQKAVFGNRQPLRYWTGDRLHSSRTRAPLLEGSLGLLGRIFGKTAKGIDKAGRDVRLKFNWRGLCIERTSFGVDADFVEKFHPNGTIKESRLLTKKGAIIELNYFSGNDLN